MAYMEAAAGRYQYEWKMFPVEQVVIMNQIHFLVGNFVTRMLKGEDPQMGGVSGEDKRQANYQQVRSRNYIKMAIR